jgi:hypothetical protein
VRITKRQLKRIIREESEALRAENLLRRLVRESLIRSNGRLDEGFFDKLKGAGEKLMGMFKGDPVKAAGKVMKTQRDAFRGLDDIINSVENSQRAGDLEKLFPGDDEFKKILDLASTGGYGRPAQAKGDLQAAIVNAFLRSDVVAKAFRNAAGQAGYYEKAPDREEMIANAITGGDNEAMQDKKVKSIAASLAEDFDDAIKEYGDPAESVGDYKKRMKGASSITMAAREAADNVLENIQ